MHGILRGLLRARRALALETGVMFQQRANYILCKPPKDNIGAAESVFVLTVFAVSILGPSGWILAHLDDYRKSD